MNIEQLQNILHTSGSFDTPYHEDSIMSYGKICNHDDGYLCEHRRRYIIDFIKKNTEIDFQENTDMNNYNCSGSPFYPEISENKKHDEDNFEYNPRGWYEKQSQELQKAADEAYDNNGDEGWYWFLSGCKWYQEQLKKVI